VGIKLVAEAPGDFVGQVTVTTELAVLTLTVSAKVLPLSPACAAGHVDGGDASQQCCTPVD
jgi:hypothetical protein